LRLHRGVCLLAAFVSLAACEAGPPAFGYPADEAGTHRPADTAGAASSGDPAAAAEVEPGVTAADSGARQEVPAPADSASASASGGGEPGPRSSTGTGVGNVREASRWGSVPSLTTATATTATAGPDSARALQGTDAYRLDGQGGSGGVVVEPPPSAEPDEPDRAARARFPRPGNIRGLYVNAWAAGSRGRMSEILDIAGRTEINTLVIDIKDASGYVSHRTEVPLAHQIGATGEVRIADIEALLDKLDSAGVYPIARIVIVKDPILAQFRPELAVQDTAGGVWVDDKGTTWLNPYDTTVWEYHVALAREVAGLGFPEIQWDYVRFPDAPASHLDRAVFHGGDGRTKARAVRDFLAYSRERLAELGVVTTADVFGVTTSAASDVGIGQLWESFIDVVDVALPMVYPSHYWQGSFGVDTPNAYPYEIVRHALTDAVRRSGRVDGAGATRPWLQDFALGEPHYSAPEVRAQIQATYDVGIDEWILWNPGSRYTVNALEPSGGFRYEPWVRVGGTIVPVSRRFEAVEAWRVKEAARKAAERAARDSAAARTARDTLAVGELLDTARVSAPVDTVVVEPAASVLPVRPPDTVRSIRRSRDSLRAGSAADTIRRH